MEVNQVITLLKAKDEKGLSYLYDNYSGSLNGIIFRIVGSEKLAEEILQKTFLKVWDKIHSYDEQKSTLFTWMSRIARNSAIDVKRLKSFENSKNTESIDNQFDMQQKQRNIANQMDVQILLKDLDPNQKLVLDCVYLQGYSHSEAADKLNLPLGTVKSRIRIALNTLRENLKKEDKLFLASVIILVLLSLVLCH